MCNIRFELKFKFYSTYSLFCTSSITNLSTFGIPKSRLIHARTHHVSEPPPQSARAVLQTFKRHHMLDVFGITSNNVHRCRNVSLSTPVSPFNTRQHVVHVLHIRTESSKKNIEYKFTYTTLRPHPPPSSSQCGNTCCTSMF